MMAPLLEVSHLRKTFYLTPSFSQMRRSGLGKIVLPILRDVSLTLGEEELYCLMGPNGAGKTTFLKILCGVILPDEGTLRFSGNAYAFDHLFLRSAFGLATGEERSFYWRLTGRQNLDFFSSFYPLSRRDAKRRIQKLSERFQMESYLDKYFFTYSTGAKQTLGLCRGLLGDPKILFLDEPTRSLDPQAKQEWRHFIRKTLIEEEGKTILYTTHHLEEAESFSDRIGILFQGQVMAEGDAKTLRQDLSLPEDATFLHLYRKVIEVPHAP